MPPRMLTPRDFYRLLHRIADGRIGAVESAFLRSLRLTRGAISDEELRAAVDSASVERIIAALDIGGKLGPVLRGGIDHSLRRIMAETRVRTDVVVSARIRALRLSPRDVQSFTVVDPGPARYLARRAGALIVDMEDATRANIRRVLSGATRQGLTVKDKADRIEALLGLTEKQGEWVENRREKLLDAGMDPEDVQDEIEAFEARLIRQRAEAIARTETMTAANVAYRETVEQKVGRGLLDAGTVRRIVIVTPDDRLCDYCREVGRLNEGGVAMGQPFKTPDGVAMDPSFHPNCRCVESTMIVDAAWDRALAARRAA